MHWVLGLGLVVAIAFALVLRDTFVSAALQARVEGAGVAGPGPFMGRYAVATMLFLSGAVTTPVGRALFGPPWRML